MTYMTDIQYRVLFELFHEYHEAFLELPEKIRTSFYARLYRKD